MLYPVLTGSALPGGRPPTTTNSQPSPEGVNYLMRAHRWPASLTWAYNMHKGISRVHTGRRVSPTARPKARLRLITCLPRALSVAAGDDDRRGLPSTAIKGLSPTT